MSDVAKAYPKLDVVEACEDVALLSEDDADSDHDHDHDADTESDSDHDHDHEADAESDSAHDHDHGDENAHAWMSVPRYRTMVQTIASRLAERMQSMLMNIMQMQKHMMQSLQCLKKR